MTALVPGAWALGMGVLLVLAVRRWLDPIPWRVAAVWAASIGVTLGPALVGGRVLLPLGHLLHEAPFERLPAFDPPTHDLHGDLVREIHPWQVEVRRALGEGRWPLWNAHAGAGMGLLADPQAQALQPLALATVGVPDPAAPGLLAALRMLAALSGTYLLLRRQGVGDAAAVLGSVAVGLGAPLLMWLGWPLANTLAWLPWVLYAVVRCDRRGGRRDWALLAATTAALLLAGHPETILYACGLVGAFLAAALLRRRHARPALLGFLARSAIALLVAAALAAPALLPARSLLGQSDRAAILRARLAPEPWGDGWRAAWRGVAEPEARGRWLRRVSLRAASLVNARSRGDFGSHWGEGNFVMDGANFTAAPILLLAIAGFAPARRRSGERWMQGVLAAALLIAAQPEGLAPLAGRLGLLGAGFLEMHPRILLVATFALVYVAACEADRWSRGERRPRVAALAFAAVAAMIVWGYLAHPRPGTPGPLFWLEWQWLAVELAALAAAALLLVALGGRGGARRRELAVAGCTLALAAELVLFVLPAVRTAPARLYYPDVAPARFLRRYLGEQRFVGVGSTLQPNYAQVYGLSDLRIHGPSRPAVYDLALRPLWPTQRRTIGDYFVLDRFQHPLHDLLGTRYVVAPAGTLLPFPLALRRRDGWIYERPAPLPRLFLPRAVLAVPYRTLPARLATNGDFAARSLLVAGAGAEGGAWRWDQGRVALRRLALLEPERIAARAAISRPRLLASSIHQDGGWHVLAGGTPLPPRLANGPFVAAWLPARARRVDLVYRPPGFLAGCGLAALALGGLACAALPRPRSAAGGGSG